MTLAKIWSQFMASPKADMLTEDATLTFVTTCKQFKGPKQIITQLKTNAEGLKSAKDELICAHECAGTLINEVAASFVLEFDGKPNPFLPGIDDNMFSGKKVEVPIIWIVAFSENRIHDVRIFWDQATVLKQIEVIGSRGRGWPVFDGSEQIRMLKQAYKPDNAFVASSSMANHRPGTATRDPHATLHLQEIPVEERGEYGPQDYDAPIKPPSRDYNELFVDEHSAQPDVSYRRQGHGQQRQVTLGQSEQDPSYGIKNMNINESKGHAKRNSHFEFGTPDPSDSAAQKNEIPAHQKAAIRDHNRSTEDDEVQHWKTKPRPEMLSNINLSSGSPTPMAHNLGRRGPPQPSYDAFDNTREDQSNNSDLDQLDIHGRDGWNKGRRAPPTSQYDFVSGEDTSAIKQPLSRAASAQYAPKSEQGEDIDIHGRDGWNKGRRPPPQSQYDFASGGENTNLESRSDEAGTMSENSQAFDLHGRDGWNKGRRAPPQSQYDFVSGDDNYALQQPMSRAASAQYGKVANTEDTFDLHGRDGWNKGRRAPPQSQYDLIGDSSGPQEQYMQRKSSNQRFASSIESQFEGQDVSTNEGRASGRNSQRNFTPSYELGDHEPQNVHGRSYNMGRRGPPAPSANFLER